MKLQCAKGGLSSRMADRYAFDAMIETIVSNRPLPAPLPGWSGISLAWLPHALKQRGDPGKVLLQCHDRHTVVGIRLGAQISDASSHVDHKCSVDLIGAKDLLPER
jgi:hypothetical protein